MLLWLQRSYFFWKKKSLDFWDKNRMLNECSMNAQANAQWQMLNECSMNDIITWICKLRMVSSNFFLSPGLNRMFNSFSRLSFWPLSSLIFIFADFNFSSHWSKRSCKSCKASADKLPVGFGFFQFSTHQKSSITKM